MVNQNERERWLRREHSIFAFRSDIVFCFFLYWVNRKFQSGITRGVRSGWTLAQYCVAPCFVETTLHSTATPSHANDQILNICAFRLFTGLVRRAKLLRSSPTRLYSQFNEWALMVVCALIANIEKGRWKRHGPLPCSSLRCTESTAQVNIRTHHSQTSTQRNDSRDLNSSLAILFVGVIISKTAAGLYPSYEWNSNLNWPTIGMNSLLLGFCRWLNRQQGANISSSFAMLKWKTKLVGNGFPRLSVIAWTFGRYESQNLQEGE